MVGEDYICNWEGGVKHFDVWSYDDILPSVRAGEEVVTEARWEVAPIGGEDMNAVEGIDIGFPIHNNPSVIDHGFGRAG